MRITFVVHQFPPDYFTGTEQYAHGIGRELLRRGHDVDVFTLHPRFSYHTGPWRDVRENVDGLPVRRINHWTNVGRDWDRLDYRHPLMAEVFGRHLRERGSEVVHTFHLRHLGGDLLERVAEQQRGLVVSLTDFWFLCPRVTLVRSDGTACDGPPDGGRGCVQCNAPDLARQLATSPVRDEIRAHLDRFPGTTRPGWELASRVATHQDRWAYLRERMALADALVAPTRFLRDVFVRNGAPADRMVHAGYGVDTAGIAPPTTRPERPLTFGFLGSYAEHKAPHVLIDAMQAVRGDCRAILRGRAADFPAYSARLQEAAATDHRLQLLGPYGRPDLPAVLAAIDVLVVPSIWHENAPFVVLEARAAGLPVLASRFGGLAEVVRDGIDGELFPPGDAADLAHRMQRLIDEPDRVQRYRAATTPPKPLTAAVDEFERLYDEARR